MRNRQPREAPRRAKLSRQRRTGRREVRELKFRAEQLSTLLFLCWQVCSPVHSKLQGKIIVLGPNGERPPQGPTKEPDL